MPDFLSVRKDYIRELNADERMWHWQWAEIVLAIDKSGAIGVDAFAVADTIMDQIFSSDSPTKS